MPLIFWRYRQSWALIVAHTIYDLVTFRFARIDALCGVLAVAGLVLVVGGSITLPHSHAPATWQLEPVGPHEA